VKLGLIVEEEAEEIIYANKLDVEKHWWCLLHKKVDVCDYNLVRNWTITNRAVLIAIAFQMPLLAGWFVLGFK
jgi:hypothetical protein